MSSAAIGRRPLVDRREAAERSPLVIVAAHPDDETIGASSLLLRTPGATVIHLTDGAPHDRALWTMQLDVSREEYASRRRDELRRAMAIAGVAVERVECLGGVDQEAALGLVPLARALAVRLAELRPKRVVTHPYEGGHPDHDAAAFVSRAALTLLRGRASAPPRLFEMTSYHAGRDGRFASFEYLDAGSCAVHTRVLSRVERETKSAMLGSFQSQRDVIAWFSVGLERLRRAPVCDFTRAPHAGALWYERMGFPLSSLRWRQLAAAAAAALARVGSVARP